MKNPILVVTATAILCAGTAAAQKSEANRLRAADSTFVTKAAEGGLAEVELGNLAKEKATNQKVKDFGQRMVTDHTKANSELQSAVSGKGITLPTSIDSKSQAQKTRLSNLSGAAFDRAYMEDMVRDHKADVAEFEKESNSGTDPDVKAFAAKTLPTLQEHLKLAEDALAAVKK